MKSLAFSVACDLVKFLNLWRGGKSVGFVLAGLEFDSRPGLTKTFVNWCCGLLARRTVCGGNHLNQWFSNFLTH